MSEVVEFVFFQLKPSVKPEDAGNEDGQQLIHIFQSTKHQSGHHSSAWGRVVEDENLVAWVIVWTDARGASLSPHLLPYLEPETELTNIFTTLTPPISSTDTLTTNPVTELCALAFPTSYTADDHISLHQNLLDFRAALTQDLPVYDRPKSWAMGTVERPGTVQHDASPTGKAFVHFLAVGWESVEKHKTIKESRQFTGSIEPIREKMLAPVEGLKMKHVSFQRI